MFAVEPADHAALTSPWCATGSCAARPISRSPAAHRTERARTERVGAAAGPLALVAGAALSRSLSHSRDPTASAAYVPSSVHAQGLTGQP